MDVRVGTLHASVILISAALKTPPVLDNGKDVNCPFR
jgi:hypothetical protein